MNVIPELLFYTTCWKYDCSENILTPLSSQREKKKKTGEELSYIISSEQMPKLLLHTCILRYFYFYFGYLLGFS